MSWTRVTKYAAIVAISASLCACANAGPDFAAPVLAAPARVARNGSDIVPQIGPQNADDTAEWWLSLNAPRLNIIIHDSLAANLTIQEADAALDAARASRDIAFGGRAPEGALNVSAERTRINTAAFGFDAFPSLTTSRYSTGLGVSYDLDLFGGAHREREAATARFEAEEYRRDAARLTLAAQIASTAIEIAGLRAEFMVLEEIVEDDRATLALVDRAVEAGAAGSIDRIRVRTQLAQDAAAVPGVRNHLSAAQTSLAILAGRAPGALTAPPFTLSDFSPSDRGPEGVPSDRLRGRPDILAAEAALHAATADIGVRVANLYPQVRLSANYTQTALSAGDLFSYRSSGWALGPSITLPIFRRAALHADVRRAEAEARRADARYRATVMRAFGEVADAFTNLAAARSELVLRTDAQGLAEENLRLARRAYQLGAGRLPDVLDAQRQANIARRARAQTEAGRLLAIVRLSSAIAASPNFDEATVKNK